MIGNHFSDVFTTLHCLTLVVIINMLTDFIAMLVSPMQCTKFDGVLKLLQNFLKASFM